MSIDSHALKAMIRAELAQMSDARVVAQVEALLVEPSVTMRGWDYSDERVEYPCWTVFSHPASNTGIAYCEYGFGPRSPWGLVFLEGKMTSIGMDCGWYTTFLEVFFETSAATELAIWRVRKTEADWTKSQWITEEGEWDATWARVMELRESDPESRYHCDMSIEYPKE